MVLVPVNADLECLEIPITNANLNVKLILTAIYKKPAFKINARILVLELAVLMQFALLRTIGPSAPVHQITLEMPL
jgi:hypothetical protein